MLAKNRHDKFGSKRKAAAETAKYTFRQCTILHLHKLYTSLQSIALNILELWSQGLIQHLASTEWLYDASKLHTPP